MADPTGPQPVDVLTVLRTITAEQLTERTEQREDGWPEGGGWSHTIEELQERLDAYDHAITALQQIQRTCEACVSGCTQRLHHACEVAIWDTADALDQSAPAEVQP